MSRARRAAVVAGVLVVVALVVVIAWRASDDASSDEPTSRVERGLIEDVGNASEPFAALTEGTITVGGRDVRVVVADEEPERIAGLRGRADAAPYDGMLFVFDADTRAAFTMAGVPEPLEIGFYAADGTPVDRLRMEPCAGNDATCPIYEPSGAFRYALETEPGALPPGRLRVGVTPRS